MFEYLAKIKSQKGQSLVETLIAVAVIVVGLVGIITLVVSAVVAGRVSKETVTATNLAREGVEVVREIRDTNWMQEKGFNENLLKGGDVRYARASFDSKTNGWQLESGTTTNLFDNEYKLYFDDYYNHERKGDDSGYFRMIEIRKDPTDANQLIIKSSCGWIKDGKQKEIVLEDILTDWLTKAEVE